MVEYRDYYQILGVPRDADEKEIRRAYRKLARKYHPDVNPGDAEAAEKFKSINEAYEVLSDPEKRRKYDQFGQAWQRYQQAGARGGFDWSPWIHTTPGTYSYATVDDLEDLFGGVGFSEFFETLFGRVTGGSRSRAGVPPRRGSDVRQPVSITLSEAYHGTTRLVTKNGRRLEVRIPAGVRSGSKVRLAGEGAQGQYGGSAGDLYLVVEVEPDPRFERVGDDLHTKVAVPLYTAVLGGEVPVQTLAGSIQLKIPPGTQNGRRFRIPGKGMPKLKSPGMFGDLYVTVDVRLPTDLTPEERELFERLRSLRSER